MTDAAPLPHETPTVPDGWHTNAGLGEIARWLAGASGVVLLTHTKPDGDAIGSTLAIARAINRARGGGSARSGAGVSGAASVAEIWLSGHQPPWTSAVTNAAKIRSVENAEAIPGAFDPEAILILDTGTWSQLEPFGDWLRDRTDRVCVIDHHLRGDPEVASRIHLDTTAAAVCEPAAELCRLILDVPSPAGLPTDIATALYLGLATDTGWFRHSNVTPRVMRLAGDLIEAGVDHAGLFELVQQRERPSRLRLMVRALDSLELVDDLHLALMSLRTADFEEAGAAPGESGGFVDIPQSVASVRVTALLTEQEASSPEGPVTKISLRSKAAPWDGKPPVDVNAVASRLGGGGHARAAGARIRAPLARAREMLLEAMR